MTAEEVTAHEGFRGRGMPDAVLAFVAGIVIGMVSAVAISRIYGVAVVGAFALASAPWVTVTQLSTLGEQLALVRRLAVESPRSRVSSALFVVVLAFSTVLTACVAVLVAALSAAVLGGPLHHPELVRPALVMVVGYAVLNNVCWNGDRLISAFRGTRFLLIGRVTDLLSLLLLALLFGQTRHPGVWGLTWATVGAFAIGLVVRAVLVLELGIARPSLADIRRARGELPDLLRFGIRTVPGSVSAGAFDQGDTWVMGAVQSVVVLGAYMRAANLATRLNDAGYRVSEVLYPTLARAWQAGERESACWQFSRWRLLALVALAGMCAPATGAAHGLLEIFGPGFDRAASALGLLLFGYSAGVIAIMHEDFLRALGEPSIASALSVTRTVIALALMVPFALAFGAFGAGLAVAIGFGVELVGATWFTERRLHADGNSTAPVPWLSLAAAIAASASVARVIDATLHSIPGAMLAAVAGTAAFLGIALLRRLLRPSEIWPLIVRLFASGPSPSHHGPAS